MNKELKAGDVFTIDSLNVFEKGSVAEVVSVQDTPFDGMLANGAKFMGDWFEYRFIGGGLTDRGREMYNDPDNEMLYFYKNSRMFDELVIKKS